jgi:hypothetical protein
VSEDARLAWRAVFLFVWFIGLMEAVQLDAGWMALVLFVIAAVDCFNQPSWR